MTQLHAGKSLTGPVVTNTYRSFFFQAHHTLSRKKKQPHRAIQCKQVAYTSILPKVGNGRHVDVRACPRPARSAWAENIAKCMASYTNII